VNILLVEDYARFAQSLELALGDRHRVVVAPDAAAALVALARQSFDAVLLDLGLPDRPGEELFAELTARWPALSARTIFLTGGAMTAPAAELLERLPNGRLEKPFPLAALEAELQRLSGA